LRVSQEDGAIGLITSEPIRMKTIDVHFEYPFRSLLRPIRTQSQLRTAIASAFPPCWVS
jgi:hypothetical protein